MRTPNRIVLLAALLLPAVAHAEEHVITQKDKAFSQDKIRIHRNETIRFRNEDPFAHNVYSRSEIADFNVKLQAPGASDVVKFDKAGTSTVRCAIHPGMKLTVEVVDGE
jgi:plastocyanin